MLRERERRRSVHQHTVLECRPAVLGDVLVVPDEVVVDEEVHLREGRRGRDGVRDDVVDVHRGAGEVDVDDVVRVPGHVGDEDRLVPRPVVHLGDVDCAGGVPGVDAACGACLAWGPLAGRRQGE